MHLKHPIIYLMLAALFAVSCGTPRQSLKVLQFNIWQEGTKVPGGYEAIADQIIASGADLVTLSEVRNYKGTRFCDRIVETLKGKGQVFYSFYSYDTGLLSKYPITDSTAVFPCIGDHGSVYRALIDMNGVEVALYTAHLDYLNCTYYDVRGYDGSAWKPRPPLTDVDSILINNVVSKRDNGIRAFLDYAREDRDKGRIVLIGGDFNEPSFLDWTKDTKDLFDHHGAVVPWTVSTMLYANGYVDAYRSLYPDPVTHPGFTYPVDNPIVDVNKLTWAPEADERERIDFIYYSPCPMLELKDVVIWGGDGSICQSERVKENTQDAFRQLEGVWPSDHKAVLATFYCKQK